MIASAALDRKLRDRLVALATGEVVAQAQTQAAGAAEEEQ